jgi:hypothetical protein
MRPPLDKQRAANVARRGHPSARKATRPNERTAKSDQGRFPANHQSTVESGVPANKNPASAVILLSRHSFSLDSGQIICGDITAALRDYETPGRRLVTHATLVSTLLEDSKPRQDRMCL